MAGLVRIKSLSDPSVPEDGTRILVTRLRPRGRPTWAEWIPLLSPTLYLLNNAKRIQKDAGNEVAWRYYRPEFMTEMDGDMQRQAIFALARRVRDGETITLLCYCRDERYCHRSLLRDLILAVAEPAKRVVES